MRPPIPNVMLSRRAKIALSVVAALIVLLVLVVKLSGTYIDYLWFGEVHARGVFSTVLWTRLVLFLVFGALMALIIGGNLAVAYLVKPPFRPLSPEQQNLQNYVQLVEPRRKLILAVAAVIAFLAAGASAQGDWAAWQLWLNGQDFGTTDPQFHLDVSFFAWDYPVYRLLLGFGFTAVIFSLILAIGIHYLTGAIRLQTPGPKITIAARRHITILVFAFMLMKAVAYWLDRYGLVFSERSRFTGASYTDVNSALPAKTILFWITLILAVGVLASIWLRSSLLPGIGFVVLLVLSILMGGVYPAIVQSVSVQPNASTKEAPYIARNIEATRQGYGIVTKSGGTRNDPNGTVSYKKYDLAANPDRSKLVSSDPTLSNLRVLDPNVVSPTFTQQQAQQASGVYGFPAKLDVDRYASQGTGSAADTKDDYIVGVRELKASNLSGNQTNWINQHTNYTHGYGFVAAKASSGIVNASSYADGGIPQTGSLNTAAKLRTPQVYFGELMSDYAIVGAKGTPREFDGEGKKVTYQGTGGISLSSPLTKLAFALDDKETNFLLNDAVGADGAHVLINRDPRERVKKTAPFLNVDGDPFPFVDSSTGHIVWMVDAYTTTANYPYSERRTLSDLTDSSLTRTNRNPGQADQQVNYIRNSVKATVDAYDGTVKLYQWDTKDPVLKTWMKVFPGLVKKNSTMPQSVRDHVRYPEDLFEVQRGLLEQYHVDSSTTFYNQSDKWTIPTDPAATSGDQPPYYVLANSQTTGVTGAQFQLTTPMKVNNKPSLAAYVTVDSDPSAYGQMTILNGFDATVEGPEQVANDFQNDPAITEYRTNQRNGGSTVILGNLLTLPLNGSFLYAQPMYVQRENGNYPLLQRVQISFDGKVGFGATVEDALTDIRQNVRAGTTTGTDDGTTPSGTPTPGSSPSTSPSTSPSGSPSSGSATTPSTRDIAGLAQQARAAKSALDEAYASKDQARIGAAQAKYNKATDQLLAAIARSASASSSTSKAAPTSSPSR
ncbi:UPF0182 family membrane protein [Jatrophihabitans endophyticus]|nr:UPF0182 family protein [Jatrophihabitans endophyticus]